MLMYIVFFYHRYIVLAQKHFAIYLNKKIIHSPLCIERATFKVYFSWFVIRRMHWYNTYVLKFFNIIIRYYTWHLKHSWAVATSLPIVECWAVDKVMRIPCTVSLTTTTLLFSMNTLTESIYMKNVTVF